MPGRGRRGPHRPTRAQIIYGNRNWVPMQISGTTPSFLAVRDWEEFSEGQMFTDRDVRRQQSVRDRRDHEARTFSRRIALGKEIRINNVSFKVIGVLTARALI